MLQILKGVAGWWLFKSRVKRRRPIIYTLAIANQKRMPTLPLSNKERNYRNLVAAWPPWEKELAFK